MKTFYLPVYITEDGMLCNSNYCFTSKQKAIDYIKDRINGSTIFVDYDIDKITLLS